jgi:hypothetical protein
MCHCRFQKAVADKLAPIEVDPNDKSLKAFFTRARNAALKGMTHDIHADIAHDDALTAVGSTADALHVAGLCKVVYGFCVGIVLGPNDACSGAAQETSSG